MLGKTFLTAEAVIVGRGNTVIAVRKAEKTKARKTVVNTVC